MKYCGSQTILGPVQWQNSSVGLAVGKGASKVNALKEWVAAIPPTESR